MQRLVQEHHAYHENYLLVLFHLHLFICGMDIISFCLFGFS